MTLKVKKATNKPKIGAKETITSVIKRISTSMNTTGKAGDAKRLYTLAKTKWGKKFTNYYTAKTSKKLTKKDASMALKKKKAANKAAKQKKAAEAKKKYAKKNTTYKEGEVFTPIWDIWISGTQLDWNKKNLITSLQIKETVDGSDTATLQVVDPEFEFIEDNIFKEDNTITIKMGWSAYTYRCTFKGYISAVDIQFGSDGRPTLTINCMDNTYKMFRKDKSKTWKKMTSAQIVKKICKSYGLKCVVEKGYNFTKQDSVSQSNQSDIEFIQNLAQNETRPFTARLVGKKFYYQKKGKLQTPKMNLHYKEFPSDVISFSPKINHVVKTETKSGTTDKRNKSVSGSKLSLGTKQGTVSAGAKPANSNSKTNNTTNRKTSSTSGGTEYRRDTINHKW